MNLYQLSLFITWLVYQASAYSAYRGVCPKQCRCHYAQSRKGSAKVIVDCSKRKLANVPKRRVPRFVQTLALHENYITELKAFAFYKYPQLRELYLYRNFILSIHKDAFRGLHRLRELSLHSNQIQHIHNDTFRDTKNLRKLYLFTNFIQEINPSIFAGLKRVETVLLHENLLRMIPKGTFADMESLHTLTLYRNYIGVLHTGALDGLKSCNQISLNLNYMWKIEKDVFKGAPQLRSLNLAYNRLEQLTFEMLNGLDQLVELRLQKNWIKTLDGKAFEGIPRAKKLMIQGNRISNLEPGTFGRLKRLQVLSLDGNNLTHLQPGMFSGLKKLKVLFLQKNKIKWIDPLSFTGLASLRGLYLFANHLEYLKKKTFFGLPWLAELNLGVNNITGMAQGAFLGLPRLLSLQLNSNKLRVLVPGVLSDLKVLYRLVLYYNNIAYIHKDSFNGMERLRRISWYPPQSLIRSGRYMTKLRSNNLQCDCNIKPIRDWIKKRNILNDIKCEKPYYVHRVNITQIKDSFLKCHELRMRVYPTKIMTEVGKDVYLKCLTNGAASFAWTRNGKPLKSSHDAYQMTSGILLLRQMTVMRGGEYTCIATSDQGISAASSIVKLGRRPTIDKSKDTMMFVKNEEMLMLKCSASGYPPPHVVWKKDSKAVRVDDHRAFISSNQSLIITKANAKDAGKYKCEATNELGMAEKITTVVFVHTLTPCQQMCGMGVACVPSYQCITAKNQTKVKCGEVRLPEPVFHRKKRPFSHDDDDDGSGDGNNVTDDEEGDADFDVRKRTHVEDNHVKIIEVKSNGNSGAGYVRWKDNT